MKLNVDIDDKYDGVYVTIQAKEWTKEIEELVSKLQQPASKRIIGVEEEKSILLSPEEIDYIYAYNRKVFAVIHKQAVEVNMKLYELEELLKGHGFTRFSKSVIGNLNQIHRFELSFNGNLCVYFLSGSKEYVSRKYVQDIKKSLILGVE
ncbi:response regulator, LytTR family protein [Halalkalibacter okhensis]|uniref:Response regulator, LytTR family protein n=1 Tax=Halalkalibacter okhensis TaxID=333138 RepID=A0A0B0IK43_9BACI|nr:response regulator, LytTR family protein [Halalkalibacter okhensis]